MRAATARDAEVRLSLEAFNNNGHPKAPTRRFLPADTHPKPRFQLAMRLLGPLDEHARHLHLASTSVVFGVTWR
jgi:hypothetical protein